MTQQVKKTTQLSSQKKASEFPHIKAKEYIESKVLEIEQENVNNILHLTQSLNKTASEYMGICSNNINACIESGNNAIQSIRDINSVIMECCNSYLSDFAEISSESIACRSLNDIMELKNNAIQQMTVNYFANYNKITGMYFDLVSQTFEPLGTNITTNTTNLRKALAA